MVDENDNEKQEDPQDREPDVLDDLLAASSAAVGTKRTNAHQTRSKAQTNSNEPISGVKTRRNKGTTNGTIKQTISNSNKENHLE